MKRILTMSVLVILNIYAILGQDIHSQFHHFSTKFGLSDNWVEAIMQDSKGFLWIGTHDGLNRFDGSRFEIFRLKQSDSTTIPGNFISNLFEDRNHDIWVSSYGIAKYSYKTGYFKRYYYNQDDDKTISNTITQAMFEDFDGDFYVASSLGLAIYVRETDNFKRVTDQLPHPNVGCFAQQERAKVWIGTDGGGLCVLDKNSGKYSSITSTLKECKRIKTLTFIDNGELWIGTWDNGIFVFDTKSQSILKHFTADEKSALALAGNEVSSIFRDSKNNIWIGLFNKGLCLYQKERDGFIHFESNPNDNYSVTSNSVVTISEDHFNNVWFGTHGGGLFYYNNSASKFSHYKETPGKSNWLNNSFVTSFAEDGRGQLWIGTDGGGLYQFNQKKSDFTYRNVNTESVLALLYGGNDKLYTVGWHGALFCVDTKTLANIGQPASKNSSLSDNIKHLSADKNGAIWLATHTADGVNIYNPSKKEYYNRYQPSIFDTTLLDLQYSSQIFHDSQNRVWICSYAGLFMFDHTLHRFNSDRNSAKSIASDYVYTIYEDQNRRLWVATMNGLDLIEEIDGNISFIHYSELYGLPTTIKSIQSDNKSNLFLGATNTIIKFNTRTKNQVSYEIDGNCNERASFKSSSGELYFGTNNGFYKFHPDSINSASALPNLYITELLVFNKPQTLTSNEIGLEKPIIETSAIELNHNQSNISIHFSALMFNQQARAQYRYMLENLDKDWIEAGVGQKAVYSNLPAGSYNFKVEVSNGDGVWSGEGNQLKIVVHPPFWKSWTFYLLLTLFLIFSVVAFFRVRLANIRRHNKQLKEMVRVRTEEVIQEKEKQQKQEIVNKELLLKQKEMEADQMRAEQELMRLQNINLEKQVELKNTDVDRKNAELSVYTLQIAHKNELLENFKDQLRELLNSDDSVIKTQITSLIKQIDSKNNMKHEWEQFEVIFNEIHQNFISRIKEGYPELTSKDLRFCAYVRMNLGSKDIAELLNITDKGVEKSRWRIRKKFGIDTGTDLNHFIQSF